MFMRFVLHANEAHNMLYMWWCLTDDGLQRLAQSPTDDGLGDGGSL